MRSLMRPALLMALLAGLMVFSAGPAAYGDVVLPEKTAFAPLMQSMPPEEPVMYPMGSMNILVKNVRMVDMTPGHVVLSPGTDNDCDSFFDIFTEVSVDGVSYFDVYAPRVLGQIRVHSVQPPEGYEAQLEEEMYSLNIMGGTLPADVMIRESPTRASTGRTMIQDLSGGGGGGGGGYKIDSFFDIFTELSLDGGASWVPASGPLHMEGVPEPATLTLLLLGGLCAMGYAWRRSKR